MAARRMPAVTGGWLALLLCRTRFAEAYLFCGGFGGGICGEGDVVGVEDLGDVAEDGVGDAGIWFFLLGIYEGDDGGALGWEIIGGGVVAGDAAGVAVPAIGAADAEAEGKFVAAGGQAGETFFLRGCAVGGCR